MRSRRTSKATVRVLVGFAAGSDGRGVAYARLSNASSFDSAQDDNAGQFIRVEFGVVFPRGPADHAVPYAALTAVTKVLVRRGIARANFVLANANFVGEISTGSGVGETLALPYVRLRCALNSLAEFSVAAGATDDLTQRARAEVALNIAA